MTIVNAENTALNIQPFNFPDGYYGGSYSATLGVHGGIPPYDWSIDDGSLPPGLVLDQAGLISGMPQIPGTFDFTVRVRDSSGKLQADVASGRIRVLHISTSRNVLWSADFETGDTSQWYAPSTGPSGDYGGGEYNSGSAEATASRDYSHSGRWSVKLTISTPPESGTRLFRWRESQTYTTLRYSAFYYFPRTYSVFQYWNVFQWKSKASTGQIDPFFVLNVGNRSNGSMYLYLYDWQKRESYSQSVLDVPIGRWFKIEAEYVCSSSASGRVRFWQDEQLLYDVSNVETRYFNGDCQWSIDNYSNGLSPSPATIYVDDAAIMVLDSRD